MTDLRTLLETATDRIEAPHLAGSALAEMRRRRRRSRSALAATAAVATVVLGIGVSQVGSERSHTNGPADTPSTPLPEPGPTPTSASTAGPATQPLWDPFTVTGAPERSSVLPDRLAPPATPDATVAERPMDGVVVAWPQVGYDLRLLGTDGEWRVLPDTRDAVANSLSRVVRPAISHDGTRVAMSTEAGLLVIDVTTGEERTIPWPTELAPPWDTAPDLRWLPGDEGFVVLHWRSPWFLGLDGEGQEAPYRGRFVSLAVDPDGPVYQNDYHRRMLLTWQGYGLAHEAPFVQCERMVAGHGLVACTTGSLEPSYSGPVVLDPETGDVVAYAPIKDRSAVYSDNGHLTALGFLDSDTLLLNVGPADFRTMEIGEESWHLVAWSFRTGSFERISSGDTRMHSVAVAPGLLD